MLVSQFTQVQASTSKRAAQVKVFIGDDSVIACPGLVNRFSDSSLEEIVSMQVYQSVEGKIMAWRF
jgi:hypothetical protein